MNGCLSLTIDISSTTIAGLQNSKNGSINQSINQSISQSINHDYAEMQHRIQDRQWGRKKSKAYKTINYKLYIITQKYYIKATLKTTHSRSAE